MMRVLRNLFLGLGLTCISPIAEAQSAEDPSDPQDGAQTEARHWAIDRFAFQIAPASAVDTLDMQRIVEDAARVWNQVGVGLTVTVDPALAPGVAERDGVNSIFFVTTGWPSDPAELALTYTRISSRTGEIIEADIAINAQHHVFSQDGNPQDYDLQNVITHEIGHALGLDHLDDPDATMYARIDPGETKKRDLNTTDETALRSHYENITLQPTGVGCSQFENDHAWPLLCGWLLLIFRMRRTWRNIPAPGPT
jgi:hypothetical protein